MSERKKPLTTSTLEGDSCDSRLQHSSRQFWTPDPNQRSTGYTETDCGPMKPNLMDRSSTKGYTVPDGCAPVPRTQVTTTERRGDTKIEAEFGRRSFRNEIPSREMITDRSGEGLASAKRSSWGPENSNYLTQTRSPTLIQNPEQTVAYIQSTSAKEAHGAEGSSPFGKQTGLRDIGRPQCQLEMTKVTAPVDTVMSEPMEAIDENTMTITENVESMALDDNDEHDADVDDDVGVSPEDQQEAAAAMEIRSDQNEDGDTPLHLAIIYDEWQLVQRILIDSLCVSKWLDVKNHLLQTPLHLATIRHQSVLIRCLLCLGAKRLVHDKRGNTPLHIACKDGYLDCVQALTTSGSPVSTDGATSDDLRPEIEFANYDGQTCLHLAASKNHLDIVKFLIEKCRTNVNQKEFKRGRTILHRAVETANNTLIRYLLSLPDAFELLIDEHTYDGLTALDMALLTRQTEIARQLLSAGAERIHFDCPAET